MAQGYYSNPYVTPTPQAPYYNMTPQQFSGARLDARPIQTISGRIITAPEEIRPNEVPMDGSISLFPTSDCGCIYAKQWNTDGTITTVKYVKEQPASQPVAKSDNYDELIARLTELKELIFKRTAYINEGGVDDGK